MKERVANPKPPLQIFTKDAEGNFKPQNHHACGECGALYHNKELAEICCKLTYCACGNVVPQHWTKCSDCRDREQLEQMEIIPINECNCPLHIEGTETFFADLGEALEHYACEEDEWGEDEEVILICCDTERWPGVDIDDYLSDCMIDNCYEDAYDQLEDKDELIKFVDAWNAKQDIVSWFPNYKKGVRITKKDLEQDME